MDIGDFFRSVFGLRRRDHNQPFNFSEENEDHIELEAEEDDDINGFSFSFGNDHGSLDDMFQHFHGDIFRQMESLHRQMDDMLKGFGTITSDHYNPFENPRIKDKPDSETKEDKKDGFTWSFSPPPFQERQPRNPRDFMLKDEEEKPKSDAISPSAPRQPKGSDDFHFKWNFKFPPWNRSHPEKKEDTDLDDKVSQREVLDLIKESDSPKSQNPAPNRSVFFSSGRSVSMTTIRGSDGKVEHKKVVRDSSGREQTTVTRSIGEQTHSVTTTLDEQGRKEHHEDFKNMDEGDIKQFEEKWNTSSPNSPIAPNAPLDPSLRVHSDDSQLFSRLFGRSW